MNQTFSYQWTLPGILCYLFVCCGFGNSPLEAQQSGLPSLAEVVVAGRDLWGEASMNEPNGPSFEFFRDLIPPPRYVHADFRYYPLILSAPNALVKSSLVSNGCGLNLRGGARSWTDNGTPVTFRVGPDEFMFGGLSDRVSEPTLLNGFLPIVSIDYVHPSPVQSEGAVPLRQEKIVRESEVYRLESFASTDPNLSKHGLVFAKFSLAKGVSGLITLDFDGAERMRLNEGKVIDASGNVIATLDQSWTWERNRAQSQISIRKSAYAAFVAAPKNAEISLPVTEAIYSEQRTLCEQTWNRELERAMQVVTPDPLVNNVWRNHLIQNKSLMRGNRIHYSALNQYDTMYESEGSDAANAALVWGLESDVLSMLEPLLDFNRKGLEYHNAGTKIINICKYYWQSRNADGVRRLRPRWEREAQLLVANRTAAHGLFPKERYCGDISTHVNSLNVNATAWRALRDLSAVLADMNESAESSHYANIATEFRQTVLSAIEKSVNRELDPPFVPIALMDQEPAHNPITNVRIGSYWNIIIGYTVASGIFPPGSEQEQWIPRYQEQRGGICMGMVRSGGAAFNFWSGEHRVNPLYGTRYALDALRRDDPDRALVSFYGMLAQGMTRNTFVGGEGCTLQPVDDGGRFFYCPPNSASNAHFLTMLRYQLVQDWDLNDDGRPDSLRLLFGTSRRWLEDGKSIRIERAPTAFGPVSLAVHSKLSAGYIDVDLELPTRNRPDSFQLRLRVPDGWKVDSVLQGDRNLKVNEQGTIDCSDLIGSVKLVARVSKL